MAWRKDDAFAPLSRVLECAPAPLVLFQRHGNGARDGGRPTRAEVGLRGSVGFDTPLMLEQVFVGDFAQHHLFVKLQEKLLSLFAAHLRNLRFKRAQAELLF